MGWGSALQDLGPCPGCHRGHLLITTIVPTPSPLMSLPSSGDSIRGGCCLGGKAAGFGILALALPGALSVQLCCHFHPGEGQVPPHSPWSKWHRMHLVIVSLRLAQRVPVATPHLLAPTGQLQASTLSQLFICTRITG